MSGNHNGDLNRALAIVDAVAASGAHALKLQTYRPDTITIDVDSPAFRISSGHELWGGENLYRLYERAHTPYEWHAPIFERARERGLTVFSSPFDATAVELLESLDAPAYKIASSELVDLPLIQLVASTGKPMVISTGMATVAEIDAAVRTARAGGAAGIVLLACTASYPAAAGRQQPAPVARAGRRVRRAGLGSPTTPPASGWRSPRWRSAPASSRST